MKIKVYWVGRTKDRAIEALTEEYLKRISRFVPVEGTSVRDESALLQVSGRGAAAKGGAKATLFLLDSRGKEFTSEQFARVLGDHHDRNPQPLALAIGGADGFSDAARSAAQQIISLGKMTLPHELARIVLLEQLYRAFTILKGHPYHIGH